MVKKKKFACSVCDADGYTATWESDNPKEEHLEIKDCDICDGKGFVMLEVRDLRKKSKKRKLNHRTSY